jgi:hypothetical protein
MMIQLLYDFLYVSLSPSGGTQRSVAGHHDVMHVAAQHEPLRGASEPVTCAAAI